MIIYIYDLIFYHITFFFQINITIKVIADKNNINTNTLSFPKNYTHTHIHTLTHTNTSMRHTTKYENKWQSFLQDSIAVGS